MAKITDIEFNIRKCFVDNIDKFGISGPNMINLKYINFSIWNPDTFNNMGGALNIVTGKQNLTEFRYNCYNCY